MFSGDVTNGRAGLYAGGTVGVGKMMGRECDWMGGCGGASGMEGLRCSGR